mmetsp:Transcript_35341/g.100648  ORF Transcript_35341/g.100648 Transcript_35341/m.100648 type:complete len:82 (+) Transcript_35341:120-365(+)
MWFVRKRSSMRKHMGRSGFDSMKILSNVNMEINIIWTKIVLAREFDNLRAISRITDSKEIGDINRLTMVKLKGLKIRQTLS